MEPVAHCAGVSTKTLYRLFPNNAALYEGNVGSPRTLALGGALRATDHPDIEEALCTTLTTYAALALNEEVVALQRRRPKSFPMSPGRSMQTLFSSVVVRKPWFVVMRRSQ